MQTQQLSQEQLDWYWEHGEAWKAYSGKVRAESHNRHNAEPSLPGQVDAVFKHCRLLLKRCREAASVCRRCIQVDGGRTQDPFAYSRAAPPPLPATASRQLPAPQTPSYREQLAPQPAARAPMMLPGQLPTRRQAPPQQPRQRVQQPSYQQQQQQQQQASRDWRSRAYQAAAPPEPPPSPPPMQVRALATDPDSQRFTYFTCLFKLAREHAAASGCGIAIPKGLLLVLHFCRATVQAGTMLRQHCCFGSGTHASSAMQPGNAVDSRARRSGAGNEEAKQAIIDGRRQQYRKRELQQQVSRQLFLESASSRAVCTGG